MSADITGNLLKSVSRSFYLSIRVLPAELREPIGLAYLLARTSDTIADTETTPPATRLRRLADFETLTRGKPAAHAIPAIQRDIVPEHAGEHALIAALPTVFERFTALNMWDWSVTSDLLTTIIQGQRNDLQTFSDPSHVISLPDAAALEDYVYLVAGSVGEWWTRLCFHYLPRYSHVPEEDLTPLANSLGKGLQLVNILRDFPADIAAGRCYLPADELRDAGVDPENLRFALYEAQPVYDAWLAHARAHLEQGRLYIAALRTRRVRIACYLPWRLAAQTLDAIEAHNPLETGEKIKVPRSAVRSAIWRSLRVAFTNKPLFA